MLYLKIEVINTQTNQIKLLLVLEDVENIFNYKTVTQLITLNLSQKAKRRYITHLIRDYICMCVYKHIKFRTNKKTEKYINQNVTYHCKII